MSSTFFFIISADTSLTFSFFFSPIRIKHWRKHLGAPPEGVQAVGQAAAILRKAQERKNRGGFGRGGPGGRGGRDGSNFGRGNFGRGPGGFGRGPPPPRPGPGGFMPPQGQNPYYGGGPR